MKIAMVTPGTYPISGAKSSSVELVVEKQAEQIQAEAEVFIFGKKTRKQQAYETKGRITYFRFPTENRQYVPETIRKLQDINPDIIQIENRPKMARTVRESIPTAKIVLILQSTVFMTRPHIRNKELVDCLNRVDAVVVNSQFLKDCLVNLVPASLEKITVNHLAVDINEFKPKWHLEQKAAIEALRKKWKLENRKILLFAGRLIETKGVHHLLNAMPKLMKADPSILLMIAGSTLSPTSENLAYVERLQQMAVNMKENVRFTSFIPHDQIPNWFGLADLVIVPSEAEPFGLVNVEAMAVGTPVIATRSGGIPEIILHQKTGVLIDPIRIEEELPSSIISLLSSPEQLVRMGVEGVFHVSRHFTWQHTAQRQLALYRNLMKKQ